DFLNEEPKGDSDINLVCHSHNVTFQMMSKSVCVLPNAIPVYKWLQTASLNGASSATIAFNFYKFLIDEAGHWVRIVPSTKNLFGEIYVILLFLSIGKHFQFHAILRK